MLRAYAKPHPEATTVMVLGICSLVVCAPLGIVAWMKGGRVVREIDRARGGYTNRGTAQAGRIMGIISTVLLVGLIALVVVAVAVSPGIGSEVQTCRTERRAVEAAVARFRFDMGRAPTTVAELTRANRTVSGDVVPPALGRPPMYWDVSEGGLVRPRSGAVLPPGCP